jgi:hypothetical protein
LPAAESPLEASQTAFDRWVDLQESIAAGKRDWAVEKEYLNEEIRLLREEIEALAEKEKQLKESTDVIEVDLKKIADENDSLESASAIVEQKLPELEAGVRAINAAFPAALKSTVEPLVNRLPKDGASTVPGVSERLQVVVGVLGQVDKFNGQLSVQTEVQTNEAGEKIQVRVLYLGLAQAWFVNQDGRFAGHGKPGDDGWVWTRDDSLAPLVNEAIAIHENTAVARYVSLPVRFE